MTVSHLSTSESNDLKQDTTYRIYEIMSKYFQHIILSHLFLQFHSLSQTCPFYLQKYTNNLLFEMIK